MTRAAVCGASLESAAAVLRLVDSDEPDLVLVDVSDAAAIARAAAFTSALPRVVVADPERATLLRACGVPRIAASFAPHELGPLIASALPARERGASRVVVVTAARGGVGRTLLATNVARRIAAQRAVWLVDVTGSGSAAWWLRAETRPWSDLEPLVGELTAEHLRLVAAPAPCGVLVLGGAGPMPTAALLDAVLARLRGSGELVVVDAPQLADERARVSGPDVRTIVLAYDEPGSLATLDAFAVDGAWLLASQAAALPGREIVRALPRDERAVAAALAARGAVGGSLGRAYDGVAELIAVDAS